MTAGPDQLPLPTGPVRERLAVHVRCRRCNRLLHDPESRLLRLGRECRGQGAVGRRHEVEQDELPGM